MKIIKEGNLKEAQFYSFDELCDDTFPSDDAARKEMRKLKYTLESIGDEFLKRDSTSFENPRVLYGNITEFIERFLNKVAASYHLGKIKDIEEFNIFKNILSDYLDRTSKFTKDAIKQIDAIEKYLNKLSKKE